MIAGLKATDDRVAGLAGTGAADAWRVAGLLISALEHYAQHSGQPCPVCGGQVLDEAWAERARAGITRLTKAAADADDAHAELATAMRTMRTMVRARPSVLTQGLGLDADVDTNEALQEWQAWGELAANGTTARLISEAGQRFAGLDTAVTPLRDAADAVLRRRSEAWQPVAAALAGWVDLARSSQQAATTLADMKKSITWPQGIGHDIRNARLAPFAGKSALVWNI